MSSISVKSFAKINLYLRIMGLRQDAFHDLETIMQNISLADDLIISEADNGIEILCGNPLVPLNEKNICHKASSFLIKQFNIKSGIKISIQKNIPLEAGLGGGSSNGAAVLAALNKLWKLGLSIDDLISFASQIGSDVPFFILGGRALCTGRGEIVKKLPDEKTTYIILIKPDVSVPTKWAYGEWDKIQNPLRQSSGQAKSKIQIRNQSLYIRPEGIPCWDLGFGIWDFINDLEDVVIAKYPIIGEIKKDLINAGCVSSMMTGSGSAVFGIAQDKEHANKIYNLLKNEYHNIFITQTINNGIEIVEDKMLIST